MQDNHSNNKRIAKNTLALYCRTFVTMIVGLYTGRIMLHALGVDNYGINNVVGGIVAMSSVITTAMGEGVSRFLTFSLGKDDVPRRRLIFSTAVNAQIIVAFIVFAVLEVFGLWFLNTTAQIPDGRLFAANVVFQCCIFILFWSIVSSPLSALIVAHEHMNIYAYISIVDVFLRLLICYLIATFDGDRLILLSLLQVLISVGMTIFNIWYVSSRFPEPCFSFRKFDKTIFKEMISFSGWNLCGTSSWILGTQGVNMLINVFFGVAINAARGVAQTVNSAIQGFIGNFTVAFTPQITKSYAAGDIDYSIALANRGTKFTWLLMYIFIVPVCMEADMLLKLWLGTPPEHSALFLRFAIFESLSVQVSQTLLSLIRATGKVKNYYICVTFWAGLVFPASWVSFYLGAPVWSAYVIFIVIYASITILRLYFLRQLVDFSAMRFFYETLRPCLIVSVMSFIVPVALSMFLDDGVIRFFVMSVVAGLWTLLCITLFGMTSGERQFFLGKVKQIISKVAIRRQ